MAAASVAGVAWVVFRSARRAAERNTGDFSHFYEAARAAANGTDLYTSGTGGYIYPPLLAALSSPLAAMSEVRAAWLWLAINTALTVGALGICIRFMLPRFASEGVARPGAAVALLALAMSFEQIRWELELGQTDSILLFAFAFAMVFSRSRPIATGVLLGFAANVKYLTLIALPYLIVRRRYKAAAATLVSTVGWALAPAIMLGWGTNLSYLQRAVSGLAGTAGVADRAADAAAPNSLVWHRSVSVTSASARLAESLGLGNAAGLGFAAAVALGVLGVVWLIYRRNGWDLMRGERRAADTRGARMEAGNAEWLAAFEWSGLIVAVLAFGPQTTTRHMYLMVLPHVLAATLLIAPVRGADRRWILAGVILFQLGTRLPPGGMGMDGAVEAWRRIGGASWCLLAMFLLMLRGGLRAKLRPG